MSFRDFGYAETLYLILLVALVDGSSARRFPLIRKVLGSMPSAADRYRNCMYIFFMSKNCLVFNFCPVCFSIYIYIFRKTRKNCTKNKVNARIKRFDFNL